MDEMGVLQSQQFALGLSFGFLASAIEAGEDHLENYNKYIAEAPN